MQNSDVQARFRQARALAAKGSLVIVPRDGPFLTLPAITPPTVSPQMLVAVERLMPSTSKCSVAVISDVTWSAGISPSLKAASEAIPFFGLLMGLSSIGHSVWVFSGADNLLRSACEDADVLIVDSASVAALPANWQTEAAKAMRNPQILLHDRTSYRLVPAVQEKLN